MQFDLEQEKQRKILQNRLIRFFIAMLAAILVSEALITMLINRFILPALQKQFLQGSVWEADLTGIQLIVLLSGTILIILLQVLGWLMPFYAGSIQILQERLGSWIAGRVPQITNASVIRNMGGREGFFLFLIFTGILLLKILPYLIFGIRYIRYVVQSVEQVREQDRKYYAEIEKNRNLMLSDIAHDIRNPITTVSGYAQALADGMVRDPEKQREYLGAIRRKTARVSDLIQLLFEYAKLNSTGFTLEKKRIDLGELLRENAAEMYADAEEKGMELVPEIPEETVPVNGDPVQLSRVFNNLITNAMRYNPAGTKILTALRKNAGDRGDTLVIIADTGKAISRDAAARIFEPFSRGDAARRTDGGSGLGLSIAQTIIRMHGWEMSLQSDIPGYTKGFVIRIPW